MRRRNVIRDDDEDGVDGDAAAAMKTIVKQVKQLDIYPKAEDEAVTPTQTGSILTLLTLLLSLLLFLSELYAYLSISHTHRVTVDTRQSSRLPIYLNLTFHSLQCSACQIDVMDVSGEQQVDAYSNVWRTRLNQHVNLAHRTDQPNPAIPSPSPDADSNRSRLDQFQLVLSETRGYLIRGKPIGPPFQDLHEPGVDYHNDRRGEGCHLSASLSVNKVAGNVHIALGATHAPHSTPTIAGITPSQAPPPRSSATAKHIHQFQMQDIMHYNASHTIQTFSFGPPFPSLVDPLAGTSSIILPEQGSSAHFQYFIKIVPSLYLHSDGVSVIDSNQYSVTSQVHYITPLDAYRQDARRIPGVFFVYDLSPFMITIREKRMGIARFLVHCCAIIGGVVTVAGVITSLVHWSMKLFKENRVIS